MTRADAQDLDARDPLAPLRDEFILEEGLIYLDGNSLGPLQKGVSERVAQAIAQEWGRDLISSWSKNGWFDLPRRIGEKIAPLVGAGPGQVVVADGTSINIFKVLAAALGMQPGRTRILSEPGNFPTDLYMVQGMTELLGSENCELVLAEEDGIAEAIDDTTALVILTQVNFRSGRVHDMAAITQAAHEKGALVCWDLCHSTGALPVDLDGCGADFAVGCGYKYLNGGPGAPAYIYVAERHQKSVIQPLSGWHGHAAPFDFDTEYRPADTVNRYLCGTQPVLSMLALEQSLEIWSRVDMADVRKKSVALCEMFIALVEARCADMGFALVSPRASDQRGSQVAFAHEAGYAIMQALIAARVVGDFRAPDVMRFGFTPLYTRYVDVWDAVDRLVTVLESKAYENADFQLRAAIT